LALSVLKLLRTTAREDIPINKTDQLTLINDRQQRNRNGTYRLLDILEFRVRLNVDRCAALPVGVAADISPLAQECVRNGSRKRGGNIVAVDGQKIANLHRLRMVHGYDSAVTGV